MESEIKNLQSEKNNLQTDIDEYFEFLEDDLAPDLSRMKNLRAAQDLKINSLTMDITALEKIIQEVQAQLAIQRSSGLEACKVAEVLIH